MKRAFLICILSLVMTIPLAGCGRRPAAGSGTPTPEPEPVPAGTAAPAGEPGLSDGERFETTIYLEGMEETVSYEHLVNPIGGFEMDYDYESFVRHSDGARERFVSVWDDPRYPENYLDVTCRGEDAETVAASVSEFYSRDYDITRTTRELDHGGECIRIEASVIKGTNRMAEKLQVAYIIPAPDGCRIATAHYSIEGAEGFGKRFSCMVMTLVARNRNGAGTLSEEQALSAVRNYCYRVNPDLKEIEEAGEYPVYWDIASGDEREIVVLFRSYTGAEVRYYIDRTTGDTYVTEFMPGITAEEERTGESFNVWEYLD